MLQELKCVNKKIGAEEKPHRYSINLGSQHQPHSYVVDLSHIAMWT